MRTVSADDLKNRLNKVAQQALKGPVAIKGRDFPKIMLISQADYRRMRGEARQRALAALKACHEAVEASGLDEKEIEQLIAEDED